jgi:fatty-acyl-CoA synthase
MGWLVDETGLDKCAANFVPLTPLSFLDRAAGVFADHPALVYGPISRNYAEHHARISRFASALAKAGVMPGDVVATILPNVPAQAEAHFGIPAAGAIIGTINTRLDVDTVTYILDHGQTRALLVDTAFLPLAEAAVAAMVGPKPIVIEVADPVAGLVASGKYTEYEDFLAAGDPHAPWVMPQDEWESIALNYTSGTTGRPKGVVYHHRGAYLNCMGQVISWRMVMHPRYLCIVPQFHCNGWCHVWMMPAVGGTLYCVRDVSAKLIFDAVADHKISHFGGAPIVMNMIVNAPEALRRPFDHVVDVYCAGAPPAPATLARIEPMGFNVLQVYGMTETYGPATESLWRQKWDHLQGDERAAQKSRQGVAMPFMEPMGVVDAENNPVPADGQHQGEVTFRGNGVMKGYYRNPQATAEAFKADLLHSGDIAVMHPDGYIQIADRAKDIIISGGENISSVEVESALMHHPAVNLCAVVAKPDETWGEVPCAFVELREGQTVDSADLIAFVRQRLAGFKTPKHIVFQELPKTSTGKIQKYELRKQAKAM